MSDHHDHGPNCTCGCHDHDHHDHHHDSPNVHIDHHDNALIGSFSCQIPGEYDAALAELEHRLSHAAERVEAAGGMIGHIKAHAAQLSRGVFLSTTGTGTLQVKEAAASGLQVQGAAIVFLLSEPELRGILEELFG